MTCYVPGSFGQGLCLWVEDIVVKVEVVLVCMWGRKKAVS